MKAILIFASTLIVSISVFAETVPTNECGRGNKIVSSWVCADVETGGSHALGAFVVCSHQKNGKNVGYTSKLDDNVVAYGGGYQYGEVTQTASTLTIKNGEDVDTLNLKTGLGKLQYEKMKCTKTSQGK